jgi:glycosyltransferase involved in cell wall biosynthesis
VVTIWDTYNRDLPESPEIFTDRQFQQREKTPANALPRAVAVLVDSGRAADRIADLYHIDRERLIELPFIPSSAVRRHAEGLGLQTAEGVRRKYDLPERFVFWPSFPASEKNHLYLLEGLAALKDSRGIALDAVFCGGGSEGDWAHVHRQAESLGLSKSVHFLGNVRDEDIPALYEAATALVAPTDCGPTNIPPLEAVTLGCPVIYADLPEFRDQMGAAALYCDLGDPLSLADQLAAILENPSVASRLKESGQALARQIAETDYPRIVAPILDEFAYIRRRWAWPELTQA